MMKLLVKRFCAQARHGTMHTPCHRLPCLLTTSPLVSCKDKMKLDAPKGCGSVMLAKRFSTQATSPILRGSQYSARLGNPPSCELHVTGLSVDTTDQTLRAAFERYGRVLRAYVVYNHVTKRSRRYGFVTYASVQEAAAGINGMDDQFLDGMVIFAAYATPKATNPQATT